MSIQSTAVPTQATSGAVHDTTAEGSPLATPSAPISDPGEALRNPHAGEVNRLNSFLMRSFPEAMGRTNRQAPESPVDVAIRLLSGLSATGVHPRCPAEYCNLPAQHDGEHGYVNYTPARG